MKRIKRLPAVLFTALLLACALCAGASARYEPIAEELAAFGLFRETSKLYPHIPEMPQKSTTSVKSQTRPPGHCFLLKSQNPYPAHS